MAGFIETNMADPLKITGGASPLKLDQSTMTVAGQMEGLMNGGNPFVEAARTRGLQAANKRGLLNSSIGVQAGEAAALDAAGAIAKADSDSANSLAQTLIKGDQANTLANIEAGYKTLMQSSASASQLFDRTQQIMNDILKDPDTSAEAKQSALDKQMQLLQSGFSVIGGIANLDLTGLLDFTTGA